MAEAILLPKLSDTMQVGVLAGWSVQVGDPVSPGDVICEIETDKATMEYESPFGGSVLWVGPKAGDQVDIGTIIAILGKPGEDFERLLSAQAGSASAATATDAAKAPAPSPLAQNMPAVHVQNANATSVSVGLPIEAGAASLGQGEGDGRIKSSPLARTMAAEHGLQIWGIQGSGEGGRVVRRDIEAALSAVSPVPVTANAGAEAQAHTSVVDSAQASSPALMASPAGGYEVLRVSQMRQAIARRLSESKFTAPHFYLTVAVDMEKSIAFRSEANEYLAVQKKDKISYNDIIIKAVASALRKHPKVNSSWRGDTIHAYGYVNVGVAVAVDEGLVVPVLRNADAMGLSDISLTVRDFAGRAREKKLKPEEMQGSTFTISNLGMFGIEEFTAIINPPEACILAVGAINPVPVVKNGEVVPGNIMKLTLSCDHRVVDGAVGSAFLQTLVSLLENPARIMV